MDKDLTARTVPSRLQPRGEKTAEDLFRVGDMVGEQYEILSVLGSGGMGQVFEALDRGLNRRVALKVAWPKVKSDRLRREAQALATLRHATMVTVHAIGHHEGRDFIVMERVYGIPLDAHIARRNESKERFSIVEVLDLLIGVAEGLAIVHRSGIAHRDIKPANIMLAPGNRVVLMDFGLMLPEFDAELQASIAGSPRYMAPEAIVNTTFAGEAHLVDLYALGVIAYEMLTGATPFDGESVDVILQGHLTSEVPDLRAQRPDIPAALARLIADLLAKNPIQRPQSVEPVLWQLRSIRNPAALRLRDEKRPIVLIVDDDPGTQKVLSFYVRKTLPEVEIRFASDGQAALDSVLKEPPDIMLLDLHMPQMSGLEVCMYLRGTNAAEHTKIVSMSAGAQAGDVELLRQLGVEHFVAKGTNLGDRLATLLQGIRRLSMLPPPPSARGGDEHE